MPDVQFHSKSLLRKTVLAQRNSRTVLQIAQLSSHICDRFLDAAIETRLSELNLRVGVYHPMPNEVQVSQLLQLFQRWGWEMYFPRVISAKETVHGTELEFAGGTPSFQGKLGILEPSPDSPGIDPQRLDLILTPGVVFSPQGDRIGMGKGYYDRFLAMAPHALRISLAFDFQVCSSWQPDSWDIRVHWIVTEKQDIRLEPMSSWFKSRMEKRQ